VKTLVSGLLWLMLVGSSLAASQAEIPLTVEGRHRIVLEVDSIISDTSNVVRFATKTVDSAGRVVARRAYELDCEVLRARERIRVIWLSSETAATELLHAAYRTFVTGVHHLGGYSCSKVLAVRTLSTEPQ
jgi:hypothetical protein